MRLFLSFISQEFLPRLDKYICKIFDPVADFSERAYRNAAPSKWAADQKIRADYLFETSADADNLNPLFEAVSIYDVCLIVWTRADNPESWAHTHMQRAGALHNLGQRLGDLNALQQSLAGYDSGLKVWTRAKDPHRWALILLNQAEVLIDLGQRMGEADQLLRAIAMCDASLEIWTREQDHVNWAQSQLVRARALNFLGERMGGERMGDLDLLDQAISGVEASLEILSIDEDPDGWLSALGRRADAQLMQAQRLRDIDSFRDAIASYDTCLKFIKRATNPSAWATTHSGRASALSCLGELTDDPDLLRLAVAGYDSSLEGISPLADPRGWALEQRSKAITLSMLGQVASDARAQQEAVKIYEHAIATMRPNHDISDYIVTVYNLGEALVRMGKPPVRQKALLDRALDMFSELSARPDFSEQAMAQAAADLSGLADIRAHAGLTLGETAADLLHHVERGRARLLALALADDPLDGAALSAGDAEALARIDQEIGETKGLVDRHDSFGPGRPLAARPGGDTAPVDLEVQHEAQARFAGALAARRTFLADRGLLPKPPDRSYEELCEALPGDGAIVTLSLTEKAGLLLILSRCAGRTEVGVVPLDEVSEGVVHASLYDDGPDGPSLWDAIWDFRESAGERDLEKRARVHARFCGALERYLETTWDWLLAATDARLREAGLPAGAPVTLVVPGLVAAMPLHAAASADGQPPKTFGDRWTVSLSPSIEPLLAATQRRAATDTARPLAALCIADPANTDQAPLPGAAAEAAVLGSACPERTEVLAGAGVTVEAVIEALPRAGIAHFACHGWFDPLRPQQSGVLLADGDVLTFERLLRIAPRLGGLRLVVLSACDSGVSGVHRAPDEFIGLPAAWLHLGAEAVLASHWPVDDVVTALTMRRFYDAFLDEHGVERQPPAAALREAVHWLRSVTNAELRETFGADGIAATTDGEPVLDLAPALTRRIEAGRGAARAPLPDPAAVAEFKTSHEAHMHETARLRKRLLIPLSGSENHRPFADPLHWAAFSLTGR